MAALCSGGRCVKIIGAVKTDAGPGGRGPSGWVHEVILLRLVVLTVNLLLSGYNF
jgi:hypothetical protein